MNLIGKYIKNQEIFREIINKQLDTLVITGFIPMVDVSQQQILFVCISPVYNSVLQQLPQYVAIETLFGGI